MRLFISLQKASASAGAEEDTADCIGLDSVRGAETAAHEAVRCLAEGAGRELMTQVLHSSNPGLVQSNYRDP